MKSKCIEILGSLKHESSFFAGMIFLNVIVSSRCMAEKGGVAVGAGGVLWLHEVCGSKACIVRLCCVVWLRAV